MLRQPIPSTYRPFPRGSGRLLQVLLICTAWFCSAIGGTAGAQQTPDPDQAPPQLDHGWAVASPSSQGFDPTALQKLADVLASGEHGQVNGLLIARNGHLVFERYNRGFNAYTLHTLQSVTKSVTAVLVALALEHGILGSVDQPIHELLPEYRAHFEQDPLRRQITLQHLLTMTTGIDWPEDGHYGADNIVWALASAEDWPAFVLSRPMLAAPGEVFNYNSGASLLLSAILQNASGMRTDRFAERYLFNPLGIPNYGWWRNTEHERGWVHTGGGLHLMPRDLAKIGQLLVSGGRWGDRQILSTESVDRMTRAWTRTGREPYESYGHQWWLRPLSRAGGSSSSPNDVVHGAGFGGQHLFVVPSLDLVVVFTAANFASRDVARRPIAMLYEHILPAIRDR